MEQDILKLALWIEKRARDQVAIERLVLEWVRAGRPRVGLPGGSGLAFIEPDLREHFPDSESMNDALRAFAGLRTDQALAVSGAEQKSNPVAPSFGLRDGLRQSRAHS